jgi:hypothetical protein
MGNNIDHKEAAKAATILAAFASVFGWILLFILPVAAFFVWAAGGLVFVGTLALIGFSWLGSTVGSQP